MISGENCFSLYTVSLHGLASHALLSVCVPSIVWLMKLQLDTVTVLPLYSKLKTNSPGSLMDLPNTYYGLTFGLGHSSQPMNQWRLKTNHLFEYINENKRVKHLEEFLQNALFKNKSYAAFAAIILSEKAALHTSHNIIVH